MAKNPTIFSPTDIAALSTQNITERKTAYDKGGLERGLVFYADSLDMLNSEDRKKFLPLQAGELCTITARPGHGKSSFMMRWARKRAADIRARAAEGDEEAMRRVVVYATYEQTIEALNSFHVAASAINSKVSITGMALGDISDEQMREVEFINVNRAADPLWFIGHSAIRRDRRPPITLDALEQSLHDIQDWQGKDTVTIDAVFIDYLQRIPYEGRESKTVGVSLNMDKAKNISFAVASPVVLGIQAKRECDSRDDPLPGMSDGEWTANVEQSSDMQIALIRPCQYFEQNVQNYRGVTVTGYQQMLIACHKQKMTEANFATWVNFDPKYNVLNDAEIKSYSLNEDNHD